MKVLTSSQMREVDRRTMALGIPSLVLMENAGQRVVELLVEAFAPLSEQRIVVLCGKGNNGGDGLVVARQLYTRIRPRSLYVLLAAAAAELRGDAAANLRMLEACGCPVVHEVTPAMQDATIVVDALLGTGIKGAASGRALDLIREINSGFPLASVVSVDIPSGLPSDSGSSEGESVDADYTVTFTAPKWGQILPPNCDSIGELRVCPIGSPPELYEPDETIFLSLTEAATLKHLFDRRPRGAHKGDFGRVLIIGGSRGKSGAAAMAGMAALRSGAGLVTVATAESALPLIASHCPELMTEPLPETEDGSIALRALENGRFRAIAQDMDVLAVGPGLGTHPETVDFVQELVRSFPQPIIIDADALNALADAELSGDERLRVLTPHPGEMARLIGESAADVQRDRLGTARTFAMEHQVCLVLKGQRSLIAMADGQVWVNPTGTPAMASAGSGDILTGLIAAFLAQFPQEPEAAIATAVYLHGRCGELGAEELGEKALIATDMLLFLPEAMDECASLPHPL